MDFEKRKLTDAELSDTWEAIEIICGQVYREGHRNLGQFSQTLDRLRELEKKIKWHEVACTIEKGEQK
jgi:hypothetical protein